MAAPTKLASQAYQRLQQKLWAGELRPGTKISESRLSAELGMSRTPIREAIRRLEREGVLEQIASSGTFVKQPSRRAIVESYEIRIAIECFAVQKAARLMQTEQIQALQDFCDQMRAELHQFRDSGTPHLVGEPLRRYLNADLSFHICLLQAADNQQALNIFNDVNLRSIIFGCRSHERTLHHVARVWLEHARVTRAIRQRDATAAARALERHMHSSLQDALNAYDTHTTELPTSLPPQPDFTEAMTGLITP